MQDELFQNKASPDALARLADRLVLQVQKLLQEVRTEEDLRIGFEKLLEPIKSQLGLQLTVSYEKSVYKGRSDAVHGQLIIEYERPGTLLADRQIQHAYQQLVSYLSGSDEAGQALPVGVGFDGRKIFFVKKREDKWVKEPEKGAYDFAFESAKTFFLHLRALSRFPLTADNLAQRFGPQSELAPRMVSALWRALKHWGQEPRTRIFLDEWKRLFGIVYGEQISFAHLEKEVGSLSKLYKIERGADFQELLFCLHTYFALLMKLIAAEILTLRDTSFGSSFASELVHRHDDELKRLLEDVESGGVYARRGVTNFLEGDFFRWYLGTFDSPELKEVIREVARGLSEFEPATSVLQPASTRDLLKKLYQYLVPKEVRHRLGEYYTPDWLAELLLNEVGYDGNTLKRLLDPACGSGTFLVLAIQRAVTHGKEKEKIPDLEIAKRIVGNIWGFDLNPLAVIAARTNYLFALGNLVDELAGFEIPIYLCDSVLTPTRTTANLFGQFLEVSTSVGKFQVPAEWVRAGGFLLARAAPLVEEMVRNDYSLDEAIERFGKEGLVFPHNEEIVKGFYAQVQKLEKQQKDGIWARFLKNVFAPLMAGVFDFVVGNPPWILWDYLSEQYRKATDSLWREYGLFSLGGFNGWLSGSKKDFSMLFTYACSDYYLKRGGKLGFLVTRDLLKAGSRGEGFRRFQLGDGEFLRVLRTHDLVSIFPFEGAANKTAAIVLKKGEKTTYPVPCFVWTKKKGTGKIPTHLGLHEASRLIQKKRHIAFPIGSDVGPWQDHPSSEKSKIQGTNSYKATAGAFASPYGVFWLKISERLSDGSILVRNLPEKGKVKIPAVEVRIEPDLVYPALRGSDILRWGHKQEVFLLMTQDPETRKPFPVSVMKRSWPRTYDYLVRFRDIIPKYGSKAKKKLAERTEFYALFNIGKETMSRFKVVWKAMTNDIYGAVVSTTETPMGHKKIIPLHTTSFFATDNLLEAHYLCAIINSKPVRDFIKSFSSAGRGFGTPSVMEHVGIPKFEPSNPLHQQLSEISQKCHLLNLEGREKEIQGLEKQNDKLVEKLFEQK